ncbi:MAG: Calx-beta domain-containing protein [Marinoscillum sp.]|uniref:Calx-beta domain-containing protein n=1 Tax=Marinoscillum sp. TaxID=2024838 RepID=UPI0032F7CABA
MSKSKINNLMGVYFSLLFFLVSFVGFSQTTFDFESSNSGFSSKAFSHTNGGYTLDVTSLSQNLVSGSAYFVVVSGSESVINDYSMAPETSTTFALSGGLTFDLVSLKVADVSDAGESLTFTTDKGTASFSVSPGTSLAAVTLSASGNPDESNLQGITYFTITSVNGYIFGFDDVVLNNISSGDTSPPSVSSITLSGSPAASASSVTYVVVFDENVSGVSADDFQVTQVSGDASGSVTGVSGSGSTYNVTVGSISGTGAIRLDLKSNTNITDASGNGNGSNGYVISYTSGGTHTVAMVTPPTVTTTMVNSFTATSATLGGNVTDDGGAEVTDRGVVISTSDTDPEIGDAGVTKDGNGSGTGVFSETIASFSGSTTYYVKAYATNSAGTSYGSVVSFTTDLQISIDDPSETEGTALTFTVSLSGAAPAGGVTVDYTTSDVTAVAGTDYTAASGTLTFAEGESSKTIAVSVTGDDIVEPSETLVVTLSNNTGDSEIPDPTGTGSIVNDDFCSFTISAESVNEDDGTLTFSVTASHDVDGSYSVPINTQNFIASTLDNDYIGITNHMVDFAGNAGESYNVDVTITQDNKIEIDERFRTATGFVTNTSIPSGYFLSGAAFQIIVNDDFAGFTVAESDGTTATSETGTTDDLTVVLDAQPSSNVVITVSSGDTGEGTVDVASLTFTNANWNTPQTVTIDGVDDALLDGDITYSITLSIDDANSDNNFDALEDQTVSVTNADDDAVQISINDPSETEGTALTFTVSLSGAAPAGGVTVDYITSDGTAVAGTDYTAASGTLTFAEGESSKEIAVTISGDETVEADETFTITLSNNTGDSEISDATGTGTITNDDQAIVTIADVSADEDDGSVTITLILDKTVDGGLTLDLSTSDGTATIADGDYTALAGETVTFSGTTGETEEVIITLGSDSKVENNETLTVSMGNLVVSTVASGDIDITGGATVTITNDDTARITINDVSGNEDDGPVALTATLDNPVEGGFSVDVNTIDGTATVANSDYTSLADHTLIFAGTAGEAYTFNVSLTSDNKVESNESLTVTLSNLVATVSTSDVIITDQAVIAIINDDNLPVISASQSFDVDENTANGTHVGIVAATDADAGTTFSNWAITDGNGDGIFVINSNTGAITVANNTNLDYEITINYELTLTVSDGTNTSSSETITINVNDLNDNIPIITSAATASVLENSTSVLTIVATDADAGTSVVYSISGGDDQTRFSIVSSTGVLTFVVAPDFESPNDAGADNVYQVSVNASDGLYSVSQDIAISVTDQNDNKPVVSIATFNIDQNQDNNTVIGTLTASDADVGTIFQNWVILSDNNNGVFTLNRNTGALSLVNQTLLVDSMVPLLVTVGDGANVSDPAVITINVEIDQETDSDGDGLLDALEDINEDGNINNDDSDGDGLANYLDDDDDGDGLTTRSEDVNQDGDPRNDDSDNDGIPDYLDVESLVAKTKIPQGISPGGDGVNDSWVVPGIEGYPDNTVYIYNRWGTLVYEVGGYDNDSKSFKGDSNKGIVGNANLPDGTYFYVIDFGNGAKRKGYLIIKR